MLKAVDEIRELLGESTDWDDLEAHGYSEWSTSNSDSRPMVAIRPNTTEQVSAIAHICTTYRVPMVPYGAGSSVEGNFSFPIQDYVSIYLVWIRSWYFIVRTWI
ncbi:d-lactate dehydrogenase (cytochrome) [Fusarium mundagurra]|uniref:D-lactate dehydrogenase (Cytochrome) n=1 Tax=Fusarium mundagurra TaxID=1567541 RepID=A0A8H5Z5P9_9HYPO|nr:d-lactate dehydrogenase (cytochrome) [Fusarium mundagurra]